MLKSKSSLCALFTVTKIIQKAQNTNKKYDGSGLMKHFCKILCVHGCTCVWWLCVCICVFYDVKNTLFSTAGNLYYITVHISALFKMCSLQFCSLSGLDIQLLVNS